MSKLAGARLWSFHLECTTTGRAWRFFARSRVRSRDILLKSCFQMDYLFQVPFWPTRCEVSTGAHAAPHEFAIFPLKLRTKFSGNSNPC